MSKSQIIKDIANSTIDIMTSLKRAKILISALNNNKIIEWINYEISGYPKNSTLPDYRIIKGELIGSYFKGSMASHIKCNNVSIPLGTMPKDLTDKLLSVYLYEGVNSLKYLIDMDNESEALLGKSIPADCFKWFNHYNNDPYLIITSARSIISSHQVLNVLSVIESKLLDALMLLENEFGNLDELDIDTSSKSEKEIKQITDKIEVIFYNDQRVIIGDNNKIKDSEIASVVEHNNK